MTFKHYNVACDNAKGRCILQYIGHSGQGLASQVREGTNVIEPIILKFQ